MTTVLIPTSDETIIPDVAGGYESNGCQVVTGTSNFWNRSFKPDWCTFYGLRNIRSGEHRRNGPSSELKAPYSIGHRFRVRF